MIITIDGPSWTGKSTVAKALAKMLNYTYVNTGAMFRAVGYKARKEGIALDDAQKVTKIAQKLNLEFKQNGEMQGLFVDEIDLTEELSSPLIVPLAAEVAKIPAVRKALLELQRKMAQAGKVIFEGRDMGSVVFPHADWKFYLDASMEIRIKRFLKVATPEERTKYSPLKIREIIEDCDRQDKGREIAPLKIPEGAIIYDNSSSPTPEQDAVVLWYYITSKDEIKRNAPRLN